MQRKKTSKQQLFVPFVVLQEKCCSPLKAVNPHWIATFSLFCYMEIFHQNDMDIHLPFVSFLLLHIADGINMGFFFNLLIFRRNSGICEEIGRLNDRGNQHFIAGRQTLFYCNFSFKLAKNYWKIYILMNLAEFERSI